MKSDHAAMGQRLRELRVAAGLPQGDVARRLEISPAYLSLLEKGKRVVQLPLLVRALELYGVEMEQFLESLGERRVEEGLARLLDEPLLRSLDLGADDLHLLSAEPKFVTTITALFNLYKNARSQLDQVIAASGGGGEGALGFDYGPFDEVTDFLERRRNFFPELESRAEALRRDARLPSRIRGEELAALLRDRFDLDVRGGLDEGDSVLWRLDEGGACLRVSGALREPRLAFQLARVVALRIFEREGLDAQALEGHAVRHPESESLLRMHLASYFAGALLLPYGEFHAEAVRTRYDVELLATVFQTSYETVAHRACNLADPRRPGVPMHFLRVDAAGNISKRYSGDGIRYPIHHGACPKMAVHLAFLTPSVIRKQYSVFPDGSQFFCFAKVVTSPDRGSIARGTAYSVGLGCAAEDARHLAYADDMPVVDARRLAVPVGTTCRFCERVDCNMRSAPSYKFALRVDETSKRDNFFSPVLAPEHRDSDRPRRKKD